MVLPVAHGRSSRKGKWASVSFLSIAKNQCADFTKGVDLTNKGNGTFLYLSVENVDELHTHLLSKRIKPLTSPQDQSWGSREFILCDRDGYRLVIFKRK